ncbi:MAG TPA: S41 family peptidase, partial [Pedobacter sp.]|nr:S41 family peptidase [Pedobacter sp.]
PWFSGSYWYTFGNMDGYTITYVSETGMEKSVKLQGLAQSAIDSGRIKRQNKENFSFRIIDGTNIGLIEYNLCEDLENFRPFCDKVFSSLKTNGSTDLIIDVRNNPGGTTRLGEILYEYVTSKKISQFEKIETHISREKKKEFIQSNRKYNKSFRWYHYLYYPIYVLSDKDRREILMAKNGSTLIKRFPPESPKANALLFTGNIYLLIGKKTYSAAAILAATFKHYNLGTLIGEETGQPTTFTANTVEIILPETKLVCSVSTSKLYMIGTGNDGKGVIPDLEYNSQVNLNTDELLEYVIHKIKSR